MCRGLFSVGDVLTCIHIEKSTRCNLTGVPRFLHTTVPLAFFCLSQRLIAFLCVNYKPDSLTMAFYGLDRGLV